MNYNLVFSLVGTTLKFEAFLMIPSLIVSFIYGGSDAHCFYFAIIALLIISFFTSRLKTTNSQFRSKEGCAAVAIAWISVSFMGALPFYFSGYFDSFIDCLFESISGFTTTGASILTNIEVLPKGIMFWRSSSQWIGGMGVLVFMLAIMPSVSASTITLLKAESSGPMPSKLVPKLHETAKILYLIYLSITITVIILLKMIGLSLYDAFIHAFGSIATSGFSNMNLSIGAYNNIGLEIIITIFMFICGINFTLFFYLLRKDYKSFFKNEELHFYIVVVLLAIIFITMDLTKFYGSVGEALRHASFQVSSTITTTGYSTTDYNLWPPFSKSILLILMFLGCCAGSTGGGIKLVRILVLLKAAKSEINKVIQPRRIRPSRLNGHVIGNDIIYKMAIFVFVYFAIILVAVFTISIENNDIVTNFTSVIAMMSNIGPGLGMVGPLGNYSLFTPFSKLVLSFCMLAGRLEIFPLLVVFSPKLWKKGSS